MRGGFGEPLTRRREITEAAQRLGTCIIRRHTEPLELLGARREMRRNFVVQFAVELIASQRRVTKEPAKAAAHLAHAGYAGLRDPRMMPSSRSAYSVQRSVSARSCARPGAVSR